MLSTHPYVHGQPLLTRVDGLRSEVSTRCPHTVHQVRELLARVRCQRCTVPGAPQNHTAGGSQIGPDRADQHAQIAQRLINGQELQVLKAGRRRRPIVAKITVIGGRQGGIHLSGDVEHQTTLDPFVRVDAAVADVDEDRSVVLVVLQILRVRL